MIRVKHGVIIDNIRPDLWVASITCDPIFGRFGVDLVITCGREGRHTVLRSKHYCGDALDWRSKHLPPDARENVLAEIKANLGNDFVVILESPNESWQHYHVHYAPVYHPTLIRT